MLDHTNSRQPLGWETPLRERIDRIMSAGIEQGVFPGGVVLVRHRDDTVVHKAYGHAFTHQDARTVSADRVATRPDTIYDLASISKVFTATCVMRLIDEHRLQLDDRVERHLAGFGVNGKAEVTVRHLLAHVAGLPDCRLWEDLPTRESRARRIMAVTPESLPGTAMKYHDTHFIVLGMLIEAIDGGSLDRAMATRILDPLGLQHTRYGPLDGPAAGIAATEDEAYVSRGMLRGEVHDENAWSLGGVAGHAGLFSTARDLSIFGQMYLNGGTYADVEVLKPATVAEMTRNQIGDLGNRGLGWQVNAPQYMGGAASPQTYGHTGFTGTSIVIDPQRDLVLVLLTNRVHPTRHGPSVDPVRRAVADAVLEAIDAT
jgi:CubicO group peptidase (beta-lactamase class C family)